MEEVDGVAGPTSVEEDELPESVTVTVVFRVLVSVAVMVVRPGTVKVRVSVMIVCDVIVAVGPTGEVKFEKEDGVTGEPSVDDVLPPVGTGSVIVYVVPVEMVTLLVTGTLLETPVGSTGKLAPVPVPYPDGLSVFERGRLDIGNGGKGPYG